MHSIDCIENHKHPAPHRYLLFTVQYIPGHIQCWQIYPWLYFLKSSLASWTWLLASDTRPAAVRGHKSSNFFTWFPEWYVWFCGQSFSIISYIIPEKIPLSDHGPCLLTLPHEPLRWGKLNLSSPPTLPLPGASNNPPSPGPLDLSPPTSGLLSPPPSQAVTVSLDVIQQFPSYCPPPIQCSVILPQSRGGRSFAKT